MACSPSVWIADKRTELLPSASNRAYCAKTYLSKAGLVEQSRHGHF
jgi:hypothetical protein